jgi:hypothetical protein
MPRRACETAAEMPTTGGGVGGGAREAAPPGR